MIHIIHFHMIMVMFEEVFGVFAMSTESFFLILAMSLGLVVVTAVTVAVWKPEDLRGGHNGSTVGSDTHGAAEESEACTAGIALGFFALVFVCTRHLELAFSSMAAPARLTIL